MMPGHQLALVLEDIQKFTLRTVPVPVLGSREVLVRVSAVGVCGTDLHIFRGQANYCRNSQGFPVPLASKPQVLGHEFCGTVAAAGASVHRCRVGDLVGVDQFLSCVSLGRSARCEYCESGDTHQCEFGQELGITGLPGAFSEYVSVPETNILVLPPEFDVAKGALIEPLGCVIHACDRMRQSPARYSLSGQRRIRRMLVLGLGPSGLLFIQYLRNVIGFDGELFAADLRERKLELAAQFGASPINVAKENLIGVIQAKTGGERLECVIEATGSGSVFEALPSLLRRQATLLFYGAGHSGKDVEHLTPLQATEVHLVTSSGASGRFDSDGNSTHYSAAIRAIHEGKIDVRPLVSHRYRQLEQLPLAFATDFLRPEYIKGMFQPDAG